jgi:RNA polymerase sigma-70 factor (ECF subfamily)
VVAFFGRFRPSHDPPPAADEPDALLVARARLDREAFAPLYLRYVEEIGRFCYVRLHDSEAARDATQQVFAQALAALPRYHESGQFRAWLYTIARNVLANTVRDRRPTVALETAAETTDPRATPEEAAAAAFDRAALAAAIARLPEDQRFAVELRLAGLTGPEVAAAMGRSHDAVKKLQLRALEKLRTDLGAGLANAEGRHGA